MTRRSDHVLIGPERAESLLSNRTPEQRKLMRQRLVNRYAKEMTAGRFQYNPQDAICIDPDGNCINGQHRLLAVVQTKLPQYFDILYDVTPELFRVIDRGRVRSNADIVNLADLTAKNGQNVHAALYAAMLRQEYAFMNVNTGELPYQTNEKMAQTADDLLTVDALLPEMREYAVSSIYSIQKPRNLIPPAIFCWTWFKCAQVDSAKADAFFTALATGENLPGDSPIYRLRAWLLERMSKSGKNDGWHRMQILGMIFKGWNLYRSGRKGSRYIWDRSKEGFPVPK